MNKSKVIITNFTDPVCTWCWGSEPVFRKLETHFPGRIEFRYVMGGLVEDINNFRDAHNDIGGAGMEATNRQVAEHWVEASERHGMPVKSEGFALFSPQTPSTYPQNMAYKAAQQSNPEKADLYLRRIREASAAEALPTGREDILITLAGEVGLDISRFIQALQDGSAEQAFREDLTLTRSLGISGFPTFIIEYGDKKVMLRGYNPYATFVSVIDMLSGGSLKPISSEATDEALLAFLQTHPRLATAEIEMAWDLGPEQTDTWLQRLMDEGQIVITPAGTGRFISLKSRPDAAAGDITTGRCG